MNVPWVDLFKIPWRNFDPAKNMAAMGGACFHYMTYSKLKKSSSVKWLNGFHYNLAWMLLGWTFLRFLEEILIQQKTWPPWAGLVFTIWHIVKLKKSSSPKWLNGFQYNLAWMFLGWTSSRFLEEILILQKTWPPWAGLVFTIWHIVNLKNLLL